MAKREFIEEAKWEEYYPDNEGISVIRCTNCHEWGYTKWDIKTPYCPCCGARMINGVKKGVFDGKA